ncbi:MAG: YafY family transcriptional regulator, partial [Candidatus Poribacteria bacterium]|nr:YafY family transcriptional regulator [Candidatus Poribacteria bacterium]
NSIESAISKILTTLPERAKELLKTSTSKISIESRKTPDTVGLIGKLYQAIIETKQIRITYYSYSSNKVTERVINPYALTFRRRSWYLIGYCHSRHKVLMFRTGRIKTIKYTGELFLPPQSFSVDDYMDKSWQVMTGKETKVVIWFNAEIAPLIKEVEWHPTQQIIDLSDGSILFTSTVAGTKEVELWVLSYGEKAEVLYPESLRNEITDIAKRMYQRYKAKGVSNSEILEKVNEIVG